MQPWIIVGAGASGAVIASRATENSNVPVLLLEAGPDYGAELPPDLRNGKRNSEIRHDWGYIQSPTSSHPIRFVFPRGRVVGGSSAVNTCIALRGRPRDYDEWELPDWTFEKCLPAFKRLENDLDVKNEWHGNEGPIRIRRHTRDELVPWQAGFLDACAAHGLPSCPDHNDPFDYGAGPHAMNKIGGQRVSVATGYLTRDVRRRDNLKTMAGALVRRVIFENRKVVGVEVIREGVVETIHSNRVVLCGGAINTVGILLRSGIGPREKVEKIGVDLIFDLPAVGRKLLDHYGAALFYFPKFGSVTFDDPLIQTAYRYTGENREVQNDMMIQPGSIVPFPNVTYPLVTLMCQVGKPSGHGVLEYRTADPNEKPRIETRALDHRTDLEAAVMALRLADEIAREKPMREIGTLIYPRRKTLYGDGAFEALKYTCGSGYHPCGTVPMGGDGDDVATDSRGRVRGVTGLHVADMSIVPTVPISNTHLTAIMIGERFGEWLRNGDL